MDANPVSSPTPGMSGGRRALTMVELMLALAITGLVSAGVAAMLVAVAYGTSTERDLRGALTRSKVLDGRLSAAIRGSRAVLETGTDYLVLWTGDVNSNGTPETPELAEIRLMERDANTNELKFYGFPSTWTQAQIDAANEVYSLMGNPPGYFQQQTADAKTAGSFQPTLWGSNVTAVQFGLTGTDPTTFNLVSYRLTLRVGELSETLVGAVSPRYAAVNQP